MHKWYSGKQSRSSSRTEDKGEIFDGMHWKQDLPQLSTASLCSVSEACWATVLFSWLRSFDTTSRNAMLCTSFWRGSGKRVQEGSLCMRPAKEQKSVVRARNPSAEPLHARVQKCVCCLLDLIAFEDGKETLQGLRHAQTPWVSGRDPSESCHRADKKSAWIAL